MFKAHTLLNLLSFLMLLLISNSCTNDSSTATNTTNTQAVETTAEAKTLAAVYENYPQAKVLEQYLKPYPDHLTSSAPSSAVEMKAAMVAYNADQYQAAIDTFPNHSRKPELIGYIHLYKGVSYLMEGKEHDAFMTFQLIRSNQQPAFEVSEWYRAICYIAYNNVYEARRKLESIIEKGTYGKEDAEELLEILPVK